jgi:hypothetical protein
LCLEVYGDFNSGFQVGYKYNSIKIYSILEVLGMRMDPDDAGDESGPAPSDTVLNLGGILPETTTRTYRGIHVKRARELRWRHNVMA